MSLRYFVVFLKVQYNPHIVNTQLGMDNMLQIDITEYNKSNILAVINFLKPISDIKKYYQVNEELLALLENDKNQKVHFLYNISNLQIKGEVVATMLRDIRNEFFNGNKILSHPNTGIKVIVNNRFQRVPPIMTAFTEAISRFMAKHVKLFTLYKKQISNEIYYNRQVNNYITCKTPIICYYSSANEPHAIEESKEMVKEIIFRKELRSA